MSEMRQTAERHEEKRTQTSERNEEKIKSEYDFLYEHGNLSEKATIRVYDNSLNGEKTRPRPEFYIEIHFCGIEIELDESYFDRFCDYIEELKGELCRIEKQTQKQGR